MLLYLLYPQTNPQLWAVRPDCQFDSFLTIGLDGPALTDGGLGAIGIDFSTWSETSGISTTSGAVYVVDPAEGATSLPVPVALLSIPEAASKTFSGRLNARGRSTAGEWVARDLSFSPGGGGVAKSVADAQAPAAAGTGH